MVEQSSQKVKPLPQFGKGLLYLTVGALLLGWILNTPPGLLGKADAIGYAVCHRIDLRSFHLADRQMPLCARCSGMYLGALLGLSYQAIFSKRRGGMPPRSLWLLLIAFVAAFALDGLNSYLHLFPGFPSVYQPDNLLRLLTGSGMGLVIASLLFPAFNQSAWVDWQETPAIAGFPTMLLLIVLTLALDSLVLTQNPLILYPLALISAASVFVILSMVYTMIWLMIFHHENKANSIIQLATPLVAGFGTALLQIIALDYVRYLITGTWEGFHLG